MPLEVKKLNGLHITADPANPRVNFSTFRLFNFLKMRYTIAMSDENNVDEVARRLALAEIQVERSKMVMDSLAGFCHALGQPATVLLNGIELLKMINTAENPEQQKTILDICYDAVIEIRGILAEMKKRREYVAESYLASDDKAGTMISLQEWHKKAPPTCNEEKK